jgi:hypothetical protein
MFPLRVVSHDDVVESAIRNAGAVEISDAASAFLASLTRRRLDLRSALGSVFVGRGLPIHRFTPWPGSAACAVCGAYGPMPEPEDLNVLNFERFKWGGVRRMEPLYAAFDLDVFRSLPPVEPTGDDLHVARQLFDRLRSVTADPKASVGSLADSLKGLLPSNDYERRVLIEILACCGIVQSRSFPRLDVEWTDTADRPHPPGSKNDWSFPAHAWRGVDGVDGRAIAGIFPTLET